MGSVSGGGVRGSESDRWKRGLLGRVDNAFCPSSDDTGSTASVSSGLSAKTMCENYAQGLQRSLIILSAVIQSDQ